MTALITEMEMPDGRRFPVCGVLFGPEDDEDDIDGNVLEGIPVLATKYYGRPVTPGWGHTSVRFFWPDP